MCDLAPAACREKTTSLKRQLEEYEEEHTKMLNMEKDREAEYNLAAAKLEGLRGEGDPKRQCVLCFANVSSAWLAGPARIVGGGVSCWPPPSRRARTALSTSSHCRLQVQLFSRL